MKIALAQMNPTVGDFSGNMRKMLEFAGRSAAAGAGLVVFPELAVCGYPPADFLEKKAFVARAVAVVAELAVWTATRQTAMLCGTVMPAESPVGKRVRNVAVLLAEGKVQFVQGKTLLPFYDVFDEQRYFEPAGSQELTTVGDQELAITLCEDAWNDKGFWPERFYPLDPVEQLMAKWTGGGAKVILNLSASPYWQGKREVREEMLTALARRHGATVAMVNQVGGNDSLIFDGSSLVVGAGGEVVARGASFAGDLVFFEVEGKAKATAGPLPSAKDDNEGREAGPPPAAKDDNEGREAGPPPSAKDDNEGREAGPPPSAKDDNEGREAGPPPSAKDDNVAGDEVAATWEALVLGTRDYVRKCGFRKVLVGLSGGIDSALVAAIAVAALGAENVVGVGMPSEFSSAGSKHDARVLADHLGIRLEMLPVSEVFEAFQATLRPLFVGTPFGLAEENLQPRIRGALLMAISNKFGALVLTTGNKSEMATGYCTLYGDMVGALAVIGDVAKTRVYQLAAYANREREVIPRSTMTKPPSAELRPGQMDTDSLPPYEVLDPILEAYVERYLSAEEIAAQQGVALELVRSVLKLVEQSEYKRQQAAPVLKVTRKSFGMGRRFPIAVKVEV